MEPAAISEPKLDSTLHAVLQRVDTTLNDLNGAFPLVADPETGEWETTADGNWCAGHWIGLLWLAADSAADPARRARFESAARQYTARMTDSDDVLETMWGGQNYLYAGFRAYDITGDRSHFGLGLEGADAMVANYHHRARQIPLGEYDVAGSKDEFDFGGEGATGPSGTRVGSSDSIYTALPALWRAYEETGDPRFRDVAISHADRHLEWHVRDDGRTWNRGVFDPETGDPVKFYNALAHSDETCWARGQGWIIAGYALAYQMTGAERYLHTLERVVDYYVAHSPDDLIPYWDFKAPNIPDEPRDTSAAAIAAYGLTRLKAAKGDEDRIADLRSTSFDILRSLIKDYVVTDELDDRYGMVLHGCYNRPAGHAVDHDLIWTDYYIAYTLWDVLKDDAFTPDALRN